jgi:hypothetical protein
MPYLQGRKTITRDNQILPSWLTAYALPAMHDILERLPIKAVLDYGSVSLPDYAFYDLGIKIFTFSSMKGSPEDAGMPSIFLNEQRTARIAISCFGLSSWTEARREHFFHSFLFHTEYALFLDYKLPERNLEYPASTLLRGLNILFHASSVHSFYKQGGLEGILYPFRLNILTRQTLLAGSITCILVRCDS